MLDILGRVSRDSLKYNSPNVASQEQCFKWLLTYVLFMDAEVGVYGGIINGTAGMYKLCTY